MTLTLEMEPDVAQLDQELRDLLSRNTTTAPGLAPAAAPELASGLAPERARVSNPGRQATKRRERRGER